MKNIVHMIYVAVLCLSADFILCERGHKITVHSYLSFIKPVPQANQNNKDSAVYAWKVLNVVLEKLSIFYVNFYNHDNHL